MTSPQFVIFEAPLPLSQKGAASGVATLDGGGKIPLSEIPTSVVNGLNFVGTWNATTNTPTLVNSTGPQGDYYRVSVAGSTTIDGNSDWQIGDWIAKSATTWDKIDNSDLVTSVAGKTGTVTLDTGDITDLPVDAGSVANVLQASAITSTELSANSVTRSELAPRDEVRTLHAAFEGAALEVASGSNGTMTLVHDSAAVPKRNFYNWVGLNTSTLHEIEILIQAEIPEGFVDWVNGTTTDNLTLRFKTLDTDTTNNKITMTVFDTAGAQPTMGGGANLTSATWVSTDIGFGSGAFTPGGYMFVRLRLFAKSTGFVSVESVKLNWRLS